MHMSFEKLPKHVAPIDCVSAKGVRCDICFGPMPIVEHPAARAARMIKQLHQDTIDLMDKGTIFTKDGEDKNFEVRDACLKQIDICDSIIARAEQMPASLAGEAFMILKDLEGVVESRKPMKVVPDEKPYGEVLDEMDHQAKYQSATVDPKQELPEIGNYDHKKTE